MDYTIYIVYFTYTEMHMCTLRKCSIEPLYLAEGKLLLPDLGWESSLTPGRPPVEAEDFWAHAKTEKMMTPGLFVWFFF